MVLYKTFVRDDCPMSSGLRVTRLSGEACKCRTSVDSVVMNCLYR